MQALGQGHTGTFCRDYGGVLYDSICNKAGEMAQLIPQSCPLIIRCALGHVCLRTYIMMIDIYDGAHL